MTAREILHIFAIGYRIESKETRNEDIDNCLLQLRQMVGELKLCRYSCPKGCDKSEIMADIKHQIYNEALDSVMEKLK